MNKCKFQPINKEGPLALSCLLSCNHKMLHMAFNIDASFLMFNSCNAKIHLCKIIEFLFCMFLKDIAKQFKVPCQ